MITIASRITGVPEDEIVGGARSRKHVVVRSAIYIAARNGHGQPWFSLPEIGKNMGGRDHSSICNAVDNAPSYRRMFKDFDALTFAIGSYAKTLPAFVNETDWRPEVTINIPEMTGTIDSERADRNRERMARLRNGSDRLVAARSNPARGNRKPKNKPTARIVSTPVDAIELADRQYATEMHEGSARLRLAILGALTA